MEFNHLWCEHKFVSIKWSNLGWLKCLGELDLATFVNKVGLSRTEKKKNKNLFLKARKTLLQSPLHYSVYEKPQSSNWYSVTDTVVIQIQWPSPSDWNTGKLPLLTMARPYCHAFKPKPKLPLAPYALFFHPPILRRVRNGDRMRSKRKCFAWITK